METKHTPGPWKVIQAADHVSVIKWHDIGSKGCDDYICDLRRKSDYGNADLIAAAPDLLEALELTLEQSLADNPDYEGLLFIDKARAALAKARGVE